MASNNAVRLPSGAWVRHAREIAAVRATGFHVEVVLRSGTVVRATHDFKYRSQAEEVADRLGRKLFAPEDGERRRQTDE